jgi:NAD(P)-dependent dehydrogenase (short-subunit alcohol dehydrogenase family)
MQDLQGKTAFVTGGASGIGLGIAKALSKAGMKVVIADIRQGHLDEAVAELDGGENVLALKLDVTDRAAYAAAADRAEARFGKVHLLVNNAGIGVVGPVELASYGDWDWSLSVNLGGVVNGIVTILPRILAHKEGGHIVSTASMSGLMPHPGAVIYATTKAAVIGMMEAMRGELEPKGVICSAFCPGAVATNIQESGKTRPAKYAETGYAESDKRRQASGGFGHLFMSKEEVGERVRAGIEAEELFICTHQEFLQGVTERAEAIVASIPEREENPEYKQMFAMLFRNDIYPAEKARQEAKKRS